MEPLDPSINEYEDPLHHDDLVNEDKNGDERQCHEVAEESHCGQNMAKNKDAIP